MGAQKCFCRCEILAERRFGFCKDFIGKRYSVPEPLQEILFPNAKGKKAAIIRQPVAINHSTGEREASVSEKRKSDREGLGAEG